METLLKEATPIFHFAYLITWSQLVMERKSCLALRAPVLDGLYSQGSEQRVMKAVPRRPRKSMGRLSIQMRYKRNHQKIISLDNPFL